MPQPLGPARFFRLAAVVLNAGLLLFHLWLGVLPAWRGVEGDFSNYYLGSRLLLEGHEPVRLYDDVWFSARHRAHGFSGAGKFSSFPPVTAFVMLPLAVFDPLTAQRLWLLVNSVLLAVHVLLLRRLIGWSSMPALLLIFALGLGLTNQLRFGQLYLLISALCLQAYLLLRQHRDGLAGALFALAAMLKYFPLIYIAVLAGHRRWRVLAGAAGIGFFVWLAELRVFGVGGYVHFLRHTLLPHLDGVLSLQGGYPLAFQSLNSLLRRLFVFDPVANPLPVFDWPPGYHFGKAIFFIAVLGSLGWQWCRLRGWPPDDALALRLAVFALGAFVLLPASATYHMVLLLLPLSLLLATGKSALPRWAVVSILGCYTAIGFIPYSWFYRLADSPITLPLAYPRLWLLAVLYCVTLCAIPAGRKEHKVHASG